MRLPGRIFSHRLSFAVRISCSDASQQSLGAAFAHGDEAAGIPVGKVLRMAGHAKIAASALSDLRDIQPNISPHVGGKPIAERGWMVSKK